MQRVLQLFDDKKIKEAPVSFGKPTSLSHVSAFPLEWRIGIDEFFQECIDNGTLSEANALLSHHESSDLMAKVLRESDTAVAIAVTAPATNLALALQKEPDLIDRISALFLMGSNYGGGPNNVYSWQMTYGGVTSSCAEDATGHYFIPEVLRRDGCRGNSMSDSGDTEWNVFLDVVAWHYVTRYVAESVTKPPIYAITSGATEAMNATLADFDVGSKYLSSQGMEAMSAFTKSLGPAFVGAGEAKWWDAQLGMSTNIPVPPRPRFFSSCIHPILTKPPLHLALAASLFHQLLQWQISSMVTLVTTKLIRFVLNGRRLMGLK